MKILVTGGTGFIGTHLTTRLLRDGNEITILTRSPREPQGPANGIAYLRGDPTRKGPWQEAIGNHEVLINLAGASIFNRWTEAYKKTMLESRLDTTRNLIEGIPARPERKVTFFSASAVGYYGSVGMRRSLRRSPPVMISSPGWLWPGKKKPTRPKGVARAS